MDFFRNWSFGRRIVMHINDWPVVHTIAVAAGQLLLLLLFECWLIHWLCLVGPAEQPVQLDSRHQLVDCCCCY